MAVLFPVATRGVHLADLLVGEGAEEAAMAQVAGNLIFGDAAANDIAPFERHPAKFDGLFRPVAPGDGFEIAAVAVDDLPAIAPGRAEADPGALEHDHAKTALGQFQRGGYAGEARTDDADIRFDLAFQRRAHALVMGGSGIPGGGMAGIGADGRKMHVHDQTVLI